MNQVPSRSWGDGQVQKKRTAIWIVLLSFSLGTALIAVATIGFLHTPMGKNIPLGRKLLSWMSVQCPIDTSKLTASEVEASRQKGVGALRGMETAPSRPALAGLKIDLTTEAEAKKWAENRGISCSPLVKGMHFLKCQDVSPFAISEASGQTPIHMLTLAFNPQDHLIAVDVFRRKLTSTEASNLMRELSADLQKKLGKPSEALGSFSKESLGGRTMKTSFVNYRFKNYLALLTATNIPWSGGIVVHEQYSSVPN